MSLGGIIGGVVGGVIGFFVGGPVGAAYGFGIGFGVGMMVDPMTPDAQTPGIPNQDLQLTSNTIGTPIFDCLGTVKISQTTLLCYGKERTVAVETEVKGGKGGGGSQRQVTGYQYYMSWAVGICLGPVDAVLTVFKDEKTLWSGTVNRPASGGVQAIPVENFGTIQFYFGTDDQTANTHIGEIIGDASLNTPYRGLCFAFMDDCLMGNYNRMPSMRFVVQKLPVLPFSSDNTIQVYDYNPIHGIWYILAEMTGLSEDWLSSTDFATVASVVAAEFHGISILFANQAGALSYIEAINDHLFSILRYGSDAKFHPKLIRDDYDVETLPLVDESALLDDPSIDRKSWIDTINEVKVQYSENNQERPMIINTYMKKSGLAIGNYPGSTTFQLMDSIHQWKSVGHGNTLYHSSFIIGICMDGTLWGIGNNFYGQLGLSHSPTPVAEWTQIGTDSDWLMAACGSDHSILIREDGTLWAAGHNNRGQLGLGDNTDRDVFTQVGVEIGWKYVACGSDFSMAIDADNHIRSTGRNVCGQLGLNDLNNRNTFVQVNFDEWAMVSCGDSHALAIQLDGTMLGAGYNIGGELGVDEPYDHLIFSHLNFDKWKYVGCGGFHTVAIKDDDTLWGTGSNSSGQLGLDDINGRMIFTKVGTDTWLTAEGGSEYSFAIKSDHTLWCTGRNSDGELGLGDLVSRRIFTSVDLFLYSSVRAGSGSAIVLGNIGIE